MKNTQTLWEKYYFHTTVITLILFFFYLFWLNNSFLYTSIIDYKNIKSDTFNGAVYPIEYVPNPLLLSYDERKKDYDSIESKYFVNIPKYDPAVFGKNPDTLNTSSSEYKQVVLSRVIYTIPYLSTYNFDYKEYTWSHPWVDIIVPKWTPVRNIANWVIVDVWYQPSWYGNYVVIRHDNIKLRSWETTTLYSLYAHMNSIAVKAWVKAEKWKFIWTAWDSWTATTSHLHFQIDNENATFHPFWPFTSTQMREAWVWFFDWVNIWLWKEQAIKSTINPLEFVNDNISALIVENTDDEVDLASASTEKETTQENIVETSQEDSNDQEEILNNEDIEETETNSSETTSEEWENTNKEQKTTIEEQIELLSASEENDIILNQEKEILSTLTSNWNSSLIALDIKDTSTDETTSQEEISEDDPEQQLIKLLQSLEDEADSDEFEKIFDDVSNDYKYYDEVKYFKDKWIIMWYDDNTFRPTNNISRIESLKVILLALWIDKITDETSKFYDIKTDSWENTYINAWVKSWIITTWNTYFYPQRQVNRVEALKMILTLAWVDFSDLEKDLEVKDVSSDDWYYNYVNYALKNDLIELDNWYFYPSKALTREELVSILYKFIKK